MLSLDFLRVRERVNLPGVSESRNESLGVLRGVLKLAGQQHVCRETAVCTVVPWDVKCGFMVKNLL